MENKTHGVCAECGSEFDYVLKPGYPRKYCDDCKAIKKQEYDDRQPVPVEKPGEPAQSAVPNPNTTRPLVRTMPKDPVGLAVEIFCAIVNKEQNMQVMQMGYAIQLVKQAQEAFS